MEEGNSLLQRMRNLFSDDEDQEQIAEEMADKIEEAYRKGVIGKREMQMIGNVFMYMDTDAKDVMTHRKNIVALDGNTKLSEAIEFFTEENYSRFPVYGEDIDEIVGIVHLRDAIKYYLNEEQRELPVKNLEGFIRPVRFIPETKSIDKVFQQMLSEKSMMMIVVDEYGQTAGIVTMEDIVEEIVGNIQDEYDEEDEMIVKEADGTYIVDGLTQLEDIEDLLGIDFEEEDYDTINGYLIECLDRIPSEEEKCTVRFEGYIFTILSVDNNTIRKVKIEQAKQETE